MISGARFGKFCFRATAAVLRRSGAALSRVSTFAYQRSLPSLTDEERRLLKNNEVLRNRHANKRCFIIGNGRSLRNQDLSLLANDVTFVMNGFWKHDIVQQWQPTYYLFSDPILYERSDPVREFFAELRARIHRSTFIVPLRAREAIIEEKFIPLNATHFIVFQGQFATPTSENGIDLTQSSLAVTTIAQLALMAALYMGCTPIYLLGLDHNWLAERYGDLNFYPGKTLQNHPAVTGRSLNAYDADMEAMLEVWKGYRHLQKVADESGCKILNATDGGYLDVFERVQYQSLFPIQLAG